MSCRNTQFLNKNSPWMSITLINIKNFSFCRLFSHYLFASSGSTAQEFHGDVGSSILKWKECTSKHTQRQCVYSPDFKASVKVSVIIQWVLLLLSIATLLVHMPQGDDGGGYSTNIVILSSLHLIKFYTNYSPMLMLPRFSLPLSISPSSN